jgi:hypothetical protein
MRKLWTLALAPILALAFFLVGAPSANAFGSEVLGCDWGTGWVANDCGGGSGMVTFSAHNLSGSYSYSWTLTRDTGDTLTVSCSTGISPCVYSGCTATSSSCTIYADGGRHNHVLTASLTLTQSGLSRTIQAQLTMYPDPTLCYC